ncbi:hypothetical protein R1flu_020090 [Riccia fluitans]|uniref:Uncharacterized protein n=1 Tax=Riccia fluitans TaxID=41844 RepID=A0ABD1ZKI4_9MARC
MVAPGNCTVKKRPHFQPYVERRRGHLDDREVYSLVLCQWTLTPEAPPVSLPQENRDFARGQHTRRYTSTPSTCG